MSLFWKFHCTVCIPAYPILYMYLATGLRKGQHWEDLICRVFIFDNHPIRLGWNKFRICRELLRTVQWSLIYSDQKDYSRLWTVSLLLKDPQGKKLGQTTRQEGRTVSCVSFWHLQYSQLHHSPLFVCISSLTDLWARAMIASPGNENKSLAILTLHYKENFY